MSIPHPDPRLESEFIESKPLGHVLDAPVQNNSIRILSGKYQALMLLFLSSAAVLSPAGKAMAEETIDRPVEVGLDPDFEGYDSMNTDDGFVADGESIVAEVKPKDVEKKDDFQLKDFKELIGILAAILTTAAAFPQLIKTWRSGKSADLSYGLPLYNTLGQSLWLAYGILIQSEPVIAASLVSGLANGSLLYLKAQQDRLYEKLWSFFKGKKNEALKIVK